MLSCGTEQRGGEALASMVFGQSDSFGRLPFSMYKAEYYMHGLSPLDFSMRPNASRCAPELKRLPF